MEAEWLRRSIRGRLAMRGYGDNAVGPLRGLRLQVVVVRRLPVALLVVLASLTFSIGTAIPAGASSPIFPVPTWTQLSPTTSPPARCGASIAYDPETGNMVLFGGINGTTDLGDTWTFSGTTWTQLSPATSPPARYGASMAYDPATGDMVLFGGAKGTTDLGDTWTFSGTTWTQLSPTTSPPARYGASMAYDPATGNMVLFGGYGSSGYLGDTWTFNGTTWTQLSPAASPAVRGMPPWPTTREQGTWSCSGASTARPI